MTYTFAIQTETRDFNLFRLIGTKIVTRTFRNKDRVKTKKNKHSLTLVFNFLQGFLRNRFRNRLRFRLQK